MDVLALYLNLAALSIGAVCYAGVAGILARRPVEPSNALGNLAFRWWWMALSASNAFAGAAYGAMLAGVAWMPLYHTLLQFFVLANALASGAIVTHALFLVTGRASASRAGWAVLFASAAFYTAVLAWAMGGAGAIGEVGQASGGMGTGVLLLLLLGFYLPHILGAVTYVALLPKAVDRSARYRTVFIACSIFLSTFSWLALSAVWTQATRPEVEVILVVVGLVSPVAVMMAYRPPEGLRRRLGVKGVLAAAEVLE